MEYLKDFLTDTQKKAISDYKYIPDTDIPDYKMKKGDYIKFLLKQNYQFMEGGIIINMNQYPIINIKSYQPNEQMDLDKYENIQNLTLLILIKNIIYLF